MTDARTAALEEAIRAICPYCRKGEVPTTTEKYGEWHTVSFPATAHAPYVDHATVYCLATPIRAIRALTPHPVERGGVTEGWQPIETAPKDGRAILMLSGQWHTVGSWNKHRGGWCVSAPHYPPYPADERPDYWMELPLDSAAPSPPVESVSDERLERLECLSELCWSAPFSGTNVSATGCVVPRDDLDKLIAAYRRSVESVGAEVLAALQACVDQMTAAEICLGIQFPEAMELARKALAAASRIPTGEEKT